MTVDFHDVDFDLLKERQRRVAAAEVVDGNFDAPRATVAYEPDQGGQIVDTLGFGYFPGDRGGVDAQRVQSVVVFFRLTRDERQ